MNTTANQTTIASPCINVCALDNDGFCKGCFRTVAEIKCWKEVSDTERMEILAKTNLRRGKSSQ
ncbi:MAG: DUF1289 domain-containing protein [Deltaproteobacteria bacterium]|nr:DUF1289 domain-containing protein [Deltaproteobacteria bacterium]